MKLNDREKKLIFIVVGVILIALSYFIGYRKISAANNKLDDKIEENRTLYNNLKEMQAREKQYLEDTEYYTSEYNTLLGSFDTGYSQEYSISLLIRLRRTQECGSHRYHWLIRHLFIHLVQLHLLTL